MTRRAGTRTTSATRLVDPRRVHGLNRAPDVRGDYVLYWMQQSQRAEWNPALEHAVRLANERGLPLLVGFGLTDAYPDANLRHYRFMLEGLRHTRRALERRGIAFALQPGNPDDVALDLARRAALVVCDRGYLRHQRTWRRRVADEAGRPVIEVEGDVVVPVDVTSRKAEYAARTIRPRIHAHLEDFLVGQRTTALRRDSLGLPVAGLDPEDLDGVLDALAIDRSVPPTPRLRGGTAQARAHLERFLEHDLQHYVSHRARPHADHVTHLGPYLHFGQISPVYVLNRLAAAAPLEDENAASLVEELVVRRELAANFVEHTPDYDRFECLPAWARRTLARHARDPRPNLYTRDELEQARTQDPYWNAAMRELRDTGYMHNAMRMYWGKKILEWTESPEAGFRTILTLNNRYFLDGRDPNSFANVAWVFGLHDRPWKERPIFGTVRYMSASGLRRKMDPDAYVAWVGTLTAGPEPDRANA
ncbi:MAG: deoxyribodipyrimidine photo-lyase [Gemmatimonadota bacterium]